MDSIFCHNVELFVKHLRKAEEDSSLDRIIREKARTYIAIISENISVSDQELVAFSSLDFEMMLPDSPLGIAINEVSDDGYGKAVEFLRARPSASSGS